MAKMWLLTGLLILASAGCTQRDWPSDLLVFTNVTGTWDGTVLSGTGGTPAGFLESYTERHASNG